jgi:hypothetical protein
LLLLARVMMVARVTKAHQERLATPVPTAPRAQMAP